MHQDSLVSRCACGCEERVYPDSRGRPRRYVNGHNLKKIHQERLATRLKVKCTYCDAKLERRPCEETASGRYFCDQSCKSRYMWEHDRGKVIARQQVGKDANLTGDWRICPECGDEFYTSPSIDKICCSRTCRDVYYVGNRAPVWRGGVCALQEKIRKCRSYRNWRKAVFMRDSYHCQECGENTRDLRAHHVGEPFSHLLRRFRITNVTQAKQRKELWDVARGQTLCDDCHHETDTYGERAKQYQGASA